jgi:hypothetical protein
MEATSPKPIIRITRIFKDLYPIIAIRLKFI